RLSEGCHLRRPADLFSCQCSDDPHNTRGDGKGSISARPGSSARPEVKGRSPDNHRRHGTDRMPSTGGRRERGEGCVADRRKRDGILVVFHHRERGEPGGCIPASVC
ncbi:unnamed protein product, partial [Scytosiphon promiscuus]